ncbi:MAG: LPXTG cell wall anchor domain-containing protein, partial [Clostridiales bacterium]|nr:LPXTG cell wall anchor domain-containing protein [Clostridiales bacterium]
TTAPVGDGSTPTKTGDIGVSALAALALISAAGVLVLARKKRS